MMGDPWAECERLLALAGQDLDSPPELRSGMDLLRDVGGPLPSGLGGLVDRDLLGGGLHAGELVEVYGAPGAGKTQMGLSVLADCIGSGHRAMYITTADAPAALAVRLHDILVSRATWQPSTPSSPHLALANGRLAAAPDLAALGHALAALRAAAPEKAGGQAQDHQGAQPVRLLIVDGFSDLLAPFAGPGSANSSRPLAMRRRAAGHRWRLTWATLVLRQLAVEAGVSVLLLSHGSSPFDGVAAVRLELADAGGGGADAARPLLLSVRRSQRVPSGRQAVLDLSAAGVYCSGRQYEMHAGQRPEAAL